METLQTTQKAINSATTLESVVAMDVRELREKEFINQYADCIDWDKLSTKGLSDDFILKHLNKLDWLTLVEHQTLGLTVLNAFQRYQGDLVFKSQIWDGLSIFQEFTDLELDMFQDELDWDLIAQYQELSEASIKRFQHLLPFHIISRYQKLSKKFIHKNRHRLDWGVLLKHQQFKKSFLLECLAKNYYYDITPGKFKRLVSKYQKCIRTKNVVVVKDEKCPVCFEKSVDCELPCGHFIHAKKECYQWVDLHNDCPICRQKFVFAFP